MDIFRLYYREKEIEYKTEDGTAIKFKLIKPTIGEKSKISDQFVRAKDEATNEINNSPAALTDLDKFVAAMNDDTRVSFLLNNEEAYQRQVVDLAPIGDRDTMSEEEIAQGEADYMAAWRDKREIALRAMEQEDIIVKLRELLVDIKAMNKASETLALWLIWASVYMPDGKKAFKNAEEVGKLRDENLFEFLKTETNNFANSNTQQEIRKGAQNKDFLAPIESLSNTTATPVTETKTQ